MQGKYKGILAKLGPVTSPEWMVLPYHDSKFQWFAEDREAALFDHYGIDPTGSSAWMHLALSLAEDHVPAYGRSQGRPQKNILQDLVWYDFFLIIKERLKCTNKEAYFKVSERSDVHASPAEIKDRLVKLKKNYSEACTQRERKLADSLASEWSEIMVQQLWAQIPDETVIEEELRQYHQHYSRYPYGPYETRYSAKHDYEAKKVETPPLPEIE